VAEIGFHIYPKLSLSQIEFNKLCRGAFYFVFWVA